MDKVLLAGASQRALVPSVIRAGFEPVCFDLFADWDTQQWLGESGQPIQVHKICRFEDLLKVELSGVAKRAIVGGGCELKQDVVDAVQCQIPLAGCPPNVLQSFHDQFEVLSQVKAAGFSVPFLTTNVTRVEPGFLEKPKSGCGGHRIQVVQNPVANGCRTTGGTYFQKPIIGQSFSSVFFTDRRPAEFGFPKTIHLGVTKQLIGKSWLGAREFSYCGSIGPLNPRDLETIGVLPATTASVNSAAEFIAERFCLNGVWGIDFVVEEAEHAKQPSVAWIVDVNPRIPASAELYEMAILAATVCPNSSEPDFDEPPIAPKSIVDVHLRCGGQKFKSNWKAVRERWACSMEAKAILFYRPADGQSPFVVTDKIFNRLRDEYDHSFFAFERLTSSEHEAYSIADLPHPGTVIEPGHPVLTIRLRGGVSRDEGSSVEQMETLLQKKAADIYQLLE